jgi:hypothetical protein
LQKYWYGEDSAANLNLKNIFNALTPILAAWEFKKPFL